MPLPRKVNLNNCSEHVPVNVYDILTKEIIFSGSQKGAANFLGVPYYYMPKYLKNKTRIKRRYTIRIKSTKNN